MSKQKIKARYNLDNNVKVISSEAHNACELEGRAHPLLAINCTVVRFLRMLKPLINLIIRLYLANLFFRVGFGRIGDWEATVFLFEHEYKLPLLAPKVAACAIVILYIVAAPMLAIGFATRYAAILLLMLVSLMHFCYQVDPENYYWMLLLSTLAVYGASKWSVDYLLKKRYCNKPVKY